MTNDMRVEAEHFLDAAHTAAVGDSWVHYCIAAAITFALLEIADAIRSLK